MSMTILTTSKSSVRNSYKLNSSLPNQEIQSFDQSSFGGNPPMSHGAVVLYKSSCKKSTKIANNLTNSYKHFIIKKSGGGVYDRKHKRNSNF